jgi:hypothetical protein
MGFLSRLTRPSPDRFARIAARALRASGAPEPVVRTEGEFSLRVGGENGPRFFLDNAYRDYCAATLGQRRAVLAGYFNFQAVVVEVPTRYEDARPNLLPKLRERFFRECLELSARIEGSAPLRNPAQPFTDEFAVELVWDQPMAMAVVSEGTLASWGVPFEQALEDARHNLWELSKGRFEVLRPGLYVSPWRDTHDASRVFLHDLVWHLEVAGDHVAFVPNRNRLIVTGSDDAAGLIAAATLAQADLQEPRPMSGRPLRLCGKEWQAFEPRPEHDAYRAVHDVVLFSLAQHYAEQKALLDRLDQKSGVDIFHANCTLMAAPTGRYTYAVWSRGVLTTLPRADRIAFVEEGPDGKPRSLGMAEWARVREVMGEAMRPLEHHPPRWTVDTFPTESQQRALRLDPFPS